MRPDGSTYGIGSLDNDGKHGRRLNVGMMGLDGMHDGGILTITASEVRTDDGMRSLHLVIDGLAKVMQQTRTLGSNGVKAELACDGAGKRRDFEGVL